MTLKEMVSTIHAAFVRKAQQKVAAGEKAQIFADVGSDLTAYGQAWGAAVANDGKLDDEEVTNINRTFTDRFLKRVPEVEGIAVSILWNGISLFGIGWKGVRFYMNKWFDLGL